ncbi:MAG: hypothetical protein ACP5RH_08535 [Leptodesmis sp.]
MNLTKLPLVSCPVILAALVQVSSPAEASMPAKRNLEMREVEQVR